MKIRAAVVRQPGQPFVIEEIDLDEPRTHEVVVRVISSGICHTDLATATATTRFRCLVYWAMKALALSKRLGRTVRPYGPATTW